jgi:D-inositol-3-phosphate glycosyltransferase
MCFDDLFPALASAGPGSEALRWPNRVAMLSAHTSPLAALGGRDTGGMNVYIDRLARELARRGVGADVYTRSADPSTPALVEPVPGYRVVSLAVGPPAPVSREELWRLLPEFADAVDAHALVTGAPYDTLHSHYWLSGLAARRLALRWGTPWAHMSHTLAVLKDAHRAPGQDPESPLRVRSEAEVLSAVDAVIASNEVERAELLSRYALPSDRVYVAPCGVDLGLFHPGDRRDARARLGLRADDRVALYVGRIEPLKGLDTLLAATARLAERIARLRVLIVGGASSPDEATERELRRLRALASRLGVEAVVEFRGPVPQDELADVYRAADVSVTPSHYESFGMAALESLACGTPVVASRIGGLQSTIRDGENGLLIPVGDVSGFAAAIEAVLCRPELRARLSAEAARTARRYSWERVADANLGAYHNLRARALREEPEPAAYAL